MQNFNTMDTRRLDPSGGMKEKRFQTTSPSKLSSISNVDKAKGKVINDSMKERVDSGSCQTHSRLKQKKDNFL